MKFILNLFINNKTNEILIHYFLKLVESLIKEAQHWVGSKFPTQSEPKVEFYAAAKLCSNDEDIKKQK